MSNPGFPDIDSLDTFGGAKTNGHPVENPETDDDADEMNVCKADVAAMTHVARRAWCRVTLAATTGAMVLTSHDSGWGSDPAVAPTPAHSATGIFTFTWPATVQDALGASHTLNFRASDINCRDATTALIINSKATSPNVITVYVFDAAGAATNAVGVEIDVYAEL